MLGWKCFARYIGQSLIVYAAYMAFVNGIHAHSLMVNYIFPKDIAISLLGTVLIFTGYQYVTQRDLFVRQNFWYALLAVILTVFFPILYYSSEGDIRFKMTNIYYVYGVSFFIVSTLAMQLTKPTQKICNSVAYVLAILPVIALSIPCAEALYMLKYGKIPGVYSFMALYYTDFFEAVEYLRQMMPVYVGVLTVLGVLCFYFYCVRENLKYLQKEAGRISSWWAWIFLIFFSVALVSFAKYTYPVRTLVDLHQYNKDIQQYTVKHEELFSHIQFDHPENMMIHKVPGTIILVIGESANRDFMKVFNPKATYPATPWQSTMRMQEKDFFFFNHAYANFPTTVPSLERALTERSQYADKAFMDSISIIDIAKKMGYKTYWFTNQGVYGHTETSVTQIGKMADSIKWVDSEYPNQDLKDGGLLKLLQQVNPNENNFIVLHIMGSHALYTNRYPSSYARFKDNQGAETYLEQYYNSILYTDSILEQVFDYANAHLQLQSMVYFSDHGEDVISKGHNVDSFAFNQIRIPFWIYLSPTYQHTYPMIVNALHQNENKYWTNDMLYDFMVGIMHGENTNYHANQDISKLTYDFTPETLYTINRKYKLSEDPDLH